MEPTLEKRVARAHLRGSRKRARFATKCMKYTSMVQPGDWIACEETIDLGTWKIVSNPLTQTEIQGA